MTTTMNVVTLVTVIVLPDGIQAPMDSALQIVDILHEDLGVEENRVELGSAVVRAERITNHDEFQVGTQAWVELAEEMVKERVQEIEADQLRTVDEELIAQMGDPTEHMVREAWVMGQLSQLPLDILETMLHEYEANKLEEVGSEEKPEFPDGEFPNGGRFRGEDSYTEDSYTDEQLWKPDTSRQWGPDEDDEEMMVEAEDEAAIAYQGAADILGITVEELLRRFGTK